MSDPDLSRMLRLAMRRTDVLRAILLGLLLGVCIVVSAFVSLSAGLLTGIGAFFALAAFWGYTRRRRQAPVTAGVTRPALDAAFDQPVYLLPERMPQSQLQLLFPDASSARLRDLVSASWQGLRFTFANMVLRDGRHGRALFRGQWLAVQTDWPMKGRIVLREHLPSDPLCVDGAVSSSLPMADPELLHAYRVETDVPSAAAAILSTRLLRSLLLASPGARMTILDGKVHLALPSDRPFFQLTGLEESIDQVNSDTQRQIAVIQTWLDSLLAVEYPA